MTNDEIRTFIARYVDAWERENVQALVDCYTENAHVESPMFHTIVGRADIAKSFKHVFGAFDDWDITLDDVLIDHDPVDRAVFVYTSQVTHRGDIFGMPGTGRRVESSGAFILRFDDGRIASERRVYDFTGLLVQLGVLKAKAV
jgi:steroid delta-isomerase-like uncharacterized protein